MATRKPQAVKADPKAEAKAADPKPETKAEEVPGVLEARPDDSDPGEQISAQNKEPAQQEAPPAPKSTKATKGEIPALFVRTKRRIKSRRRAGFRFTREGHGIALEALSDAQVEQLKSDPALEVEECTVPADPDGEPEQ